MRDDPDEEADMPTARKLIRRVESPEEQNQNEALESHKTEEQ